MKPEDFTVIKTIGRGAFGEVELVILLYLFFLMILFSIFTNTIFHVLYSCTDVNQYKRL